MLLNNEWVNEIKQEIKGLPETNEDENSMAQNVWNTASQQF